jgi:hypothetical protein
MCRSLPGRWSVPLLLLLSTGCSSTSLQLLQEPPPYLPELRSEYFTANPDSPYRNDVAGATVVPGMGRFDVLAAWGHPARWHRDAAGAEAWTYYDADADTGDALEYNLVFRDGTLERWSSRTHKQTGLALRTRPVEEILPEKVPTSEPPGGKKVPKS